MKLSNLFLVLTILSVPAMASEGKSITTHHIEEYGSLFTEVIGKSVLQQTTQKKNDFESNSSDKPSNQLFNYLSSSKNLPLSRDEFAKYLSHDSHIHEHNFVYNKLINDKGWGIHYGKDEHNICAPIPEPESYALVLIGLAMIVMVKRKKA
ncbi:PEP-CTERM sorting domain-containing protein [Methylotenera versatilis]|uniref:PEP-CTERM protein-sorting domain-containing protein n=1 Tax=Methylotenera versatilis (strain 301) TaxID=666681 RepID=D7DNT9_METV0|nr:PEP-CTERM sorting domain-containing protein [Methylotenera versatilis]ADI29106.1 protein of unknown function DUF1555 [Methylotenera versatilis 301]